MEPAEWKTSVRERYYNAAEHFPEKIDELLSALDRVSEGERCNAIEHQSL